MTIHVAVLGIDGSGKSTLTAALPALLAGELGCRAGSLGDHLHLAVGDHDLAGPGYEPLPVPAALRLARVLRRLARRCTGSRALYPPLKVGQLACQHVAARRLGDRLDLDVMVSDGNVALSALARACNYRAAGGERWPTGRRLPDGWLPDAVVLLDVTPVEAMRRIRGRGGRPDRHENLADLADARRGYQGAVAAFLRARPAGRALLLPAAGLTPGQVAGQVVDFLAPLLGRRRARAGGRTGALHRSDLAAAGGSALRRLLDPRYSIGHLLAHAPRGAWREPCFLLSGAGRQLLREGYSAGLMRRLYEADGRRAGWAERVFLGYPLHRAVRERLEILVALLEAELEPRLERGPVSVLTAPSGFADDLLRALARIGDRRPDLPGRALVVAADLDPEGGLGSDLAARAAGLGVRLRFHRGDLTAGDLRAELAAAGPFDLALFVGLSSWLPRPALLRHLRWLRGQLVPAGRLVADCFSAAAYAAGGHHLGFRASYHSPATFAVLLEACGFDGSRALVRSGRDGHNHVLVASPRPVLAEGGEPVRSAGVPLEAPYRSA